MRTLLTAGLAVALAGLAAGCGNKAGKPDGPTVDAFVGGLVQNGKPVSFPADEDVSLKVFHEKGQSFGIPIKPDGTFTIGWMPIGQYSATLNRGMKTGTKAKQAPSIYTVPGGFAVEPGKTQYQIELGKDWKP